MSFKKEIETFFLAYDTRKEGMTKPVFCSS